MQETNAVENLNNEVLTYVSTNVNSEEIPNELAYSIVDPKILIGGDNEQITEDATKAVVDKKNPKISK
jgi:hypothetical protein